MPTVTITQNPILTDPLYFARNTQGDGGGAGPFPTTVFGTPSSTFAGPYEFGGKLYCVGQGGLVMPHPPPNWGPLENPAAYAPWVVWTSADGGVTWSAPDVANRPYFATNPANPPQVPSGLIWQRIGNKIRFTMLVPGIFLPPWVSNMAFEVTGAFDLTTETYDPIVTYNTGWTSYGGGFGILCAAAVFLWPVEIGGVLAWLGQDQDNRSHTGPGIPNPDAGKGRLIAVPSVGGFPALTDITPAPLAGLPHRLFVIRSILMDSTGVFHVVFSSLSAAGGANEEYWYMKVHPDLSTSAFQQLIPPAPVGINSSFGVPTFAGNDILWPVWFGGNTLAVFRVGNYAVPAPVITYEPITLGPVGGMVRWCAAVTQGARSLLFYGAGGGFLSEVDYSYNDGLAWVPGAEFCPGTSIIVPPGYFNNGSFATASAALMLNGNFGIISNSQWQLVAPFFFGNANVFLAGNLGQAPPPPPAPITQGGFRRMVVLVPNRFDHCLNQDLELHRRYHPQRACCELALYYDENWVRAPKSAIPFRKTGTVPTPLAASGDVIVLDFQVPAGYDGIIAGLFNVYTGPGFLDGNGDLEWRLLINRVYAIHLGRVLVTLGSQHKPYPVLGGIQVQSGNRIRYIVNAPNLSGGILPINSQIVCGLEGLFYARQ